MDKYAIIENNVVNDIINIDTSLIDNDSINNILNIFFNNKLIIKQSKSTGNVYVGSFYKNNIFIQPPPFESWTLVEENWVAPEEYPKDGNVYFWNESEKNWKIVDKK